MNENIRPVPGDPGAAFVMQMIDLADVDDRDGAWLMTSPGEYQSAAAETMRSDGTGYQRVVILEWPARMNHADDTVTLRLMIAPEDAIGLAQVLTQTAMYLIATEKTTQ